MCGANIAGELLRRHRRDGARCKIRSIGQDPQNKIIKSVGQFGTLVADALEISACQGEKCRRDFRQYGCGADGTTEKTHLAHHGMSCHASHTQFFAVESSDIDRQSAADNEVDRIRRFSLAIKNHVAVDVFTLEIAQEVAGFDAGAELLLKPALEAGRACIDVEFCTGEQPILGPRTSRHEHHRMAPARSR
jgi:hypothetical protein